MDDTNNIEYKKMSNSIMKDNISRTSHPIVMKIVHVQLQATATTYQSFRLINTYLKNYHFRIPNTPKCNVSGGSKPIFRNFLSVLGE